MKNVIYLCLFLGGCASISNSRNNVYHNLTVTPVVIEQDIGNGQRRETIHNPFGVAINTTIDCDNEQKHRILIVKGSSNSSFNTYSDVEHNCSVFHWEVK